MADALRRGRLHIWADDAARVEAALGATCDPDWLLTSPGCSVIKLQRRVMVGRVRVAGEDLYVKRYNPYAPHAVVDATVRGSLARRARCAAQRLQGFGFAVPEVLAAVEARVAGLVGRSFFVTIAVPEAVTLDQRWSALSGREGRSARRDLAAAVGRLFARLHARGIYHADLKDVNLLVGRDEGLVLLDLEHVSFGRTVRQSRRVKNLMQIDRTLGRRASRVERLAFLRTYLGTAAGRDEVRRWVDLVAAATEAKDRRRPARPPRVANVGAMIVCQDEEKHIGACVESVAWCDEVVVIDGGSVDQTVDIARDLGARVERNPWPGFREQKQFGLDASRTEWVFNVDADERVPHELAARIERTLGDVADDVDGLAVPRLVPYLGRWWFRGGWYPRRIVRVVRRVRTRWGGVNPHERPIVEGRVLQLDEPLVHYSYVDVADHVRTVRNLTRIAATRFPETSRVGAGRLVFEPTWRFVRSWIVKRGILEGVPGLFVALTDAIYVLARGARVWERRR